MTLIKLNHKANTAGSNKEMLTLHLWAAAVQSRFDLTGFIGYILAANHDFKSLTNMSSGICQNEYLSIENDMDVGKQQQELCKR